MARTLQDILCAFNIDFYQVLAQNAQTNVSGVIAGTRTPPVSLTLPSPLDSPGVQPMVPSEFPTAASTTTQFAKRFRTKMSFDKFDVSCERFEGKHTFAAPDRSYRIIANVRTNVEGNCFRVQRCHEPRHFLTATKCIAES